MKKYILLIIPLLFLACEDPSIDNLSNFVPIISIDQESQTIEHGASLTLTVDIDDQDHFYHYYAWTIDGNAVSKEESYTFSAAPDDRTTYLLGVAVSDGKGLATDSILVTVKGPPWEPQPLKIYFFEVGTEANEGNIIRIYTAVDNEQYNLFVTSTVNTLTVYNRDNDPDCYRVFGGTI